MGGSITNGEKKKYGFYLSPEVSARIDALLPMDNCKNRSEFTEKALHFSGLMAVYFAGRSPEEFGEAIASGKTTRFGFEKPFPVYVAYWTMIPGDNGSVKKLADIYGRDAPVVASFAKPGRPAASIIAPPVTPTVASAPALSRMIAFALRAIAVSISWFCLFTSSSWEATRVV